MYKGMHRVWGYISDELNTELLEIADREQRKLANVISLLLQQAVKERNRKRNGKKANTEYNSPNVGEMYGQ
jgi:hypothetical protein